MPVEKIMREITTIVEKDFYICPACRREHASEDAAILCVEKDRELAEESRRAMEKSNREYAEKVDMVIEQMPVIDEEVYEREAILLALAYAPPIYPCLGCGHPHVGGYICPNPDCPGEPGEASDIDTEVLFYDDAFCLPDDGWKITYDKL